jgi:hypothetical protein
MALDVIGKIIQVMDPVRGTSKAGKDWVKQEFILETQETYPKKICIGMMGEKTNEISKYRVEDMVKVHLNIESREYNGKWYTNINAWKIEQAGTNPNAGTSAAPASSMGAEPEVNYGSSMPDASGDELPF